MPAIRKPGDNFLSGIVAEQGRKLKRHADSPFDPNEDPVIIGDGAIIDDGAGSTATPDNPEGEGYAGAVVIGPGANTDGTSYYGAVVIGRATTCYGPSSSIVIGDGAVGQGVGGGDNVVVGGGASVFGDENVAIGPGADVGGDESVAVGHDAQTSDLNCVAVGNESYASGEGGAATGASASAQENAVAVGYNAQAAGQPSTGSIAIGHNAEANNPEEGIAIGDSATIYSGSDGCTVVGAGASATGQSSVLVGRGTDDDGFQNTVVLGYGATATDNSQVMLGAAGTGPYAEVPDAGGSFVLASPDGTRWRITVDNAGALSTALA